MEYDRLRLFGGHCRLINGTRGADRISKARFFYNANENKEKLYICNVNDNP